MAPHAPRMFCALLLAWVLKKKRGIYKGQGKDEYPLNWNKTPRNHHLFLLSCHLIFIYYFRYTGDHYCMSHSQKGPSFYGYWVCWGPKFWQCGHHLLMLACMGLSDSSSHNLLYQSGLLRFLSDLRWLYAICIPANKEGETFVT